jgi:hypothetical protein
MMTLTKGLFLLFLLNLQWVFAQLIEFELHDSWLAKWHGYCRAIIICHTIPINTIAGGIQISIFIRTKNLPPR